MLLYQSLLISSKKSLITYARADVAIPNARLTEWPGGCRTANVGPPASEVLLEFNEGQGGCTAARGARLVRRRKEDRRQNLVNVSGPCGKP